MTTTRISLLQRLATKQDGIAWAKFVRLYTPLVHRWVSSLGVREPDSHDIVQEVFLVLLNKISSFDYRPTQSFRAWLRTITLNKCRDYLRKKQRKTEPTFDSRIEAAEQSDEQLLTLNEYREYLINAAMKLMKTHFSDKTWLACWKHVAEGKRASDVASELGMTENAVYLARGRVLTRLRQELDGLWE